MSNSWDTTHFQQQGGGGGQPQQQVGGVKLFDPSQFQATQPPSATQGDAAQQQQQHYPQDPNAGTYYNAEPQPGQVSSWDNWGSWNWSTDGQTAPLGVALQGQAGATGVGEGGAPVDQHPPGQQGAQFVGQHQQEPPMGQFYNPQQYQNGTAAPEAAQALQNPAGSHPEQAATGEYPGWRWDQDQGQWVPTDSPGMGQQQGLAVAGQDTSGLYFYQGQQAHLDPVTWNNSDPSQSCQWGNSVDPQAQPGAGQEAGQSLQWADGQDQQSVADGIRQPNTSGLTGAPESNQSAGVSFASAGGGGVGVALPPSVDVTSQPPAVSEVHVGQGHARESSMDSNASGTVAGFFHHGDDEVPSQQQVPVAAAAEAAATMQHLKVTAMQRTDSGISNASLQTFNMSEDEDMRDGVEEMTNQMVSLELKPGQMGQQVQPGSIDSSQQYAHPGDFSGFGNYSTANGPQGNKAGQQTATAVPSGSRESDQQSPMMNDWEIVPPQAHSSASHSRDNSLDGGVSFSAKPQEPASSSNPHTDGKPQVPLEANPVGSQSATTQDSESFTAISSTSSASGDMQGSFPFSQASSYYPSASSTPFTSPGAQSVLSQPSSIPSFQSSPQKTTAADPSPSPVLPPPSVPEAKDRQAEQGGSVGSTPSVHSSPEKTLDTSHKTKDSEKSLYSSAVSGRGSDTSKPSLSEGGVRSGRPPPSPGPRGSVGGQEKEGGQLSSPARRHHSAFHPVHSQRAKHNMSPATTLWDNLDTAPTGNILLAPAAPLIIPSLGGSTAQSSATTSVTAATTTTTATATTTTTTSAAQPALGKSSADSSSLEKLSSREGGKKGREREGGRYGAGRRSGERSNLNKNGELSRSRDEDNRSLGSLDELDATPDFTDDSFSRGDRSRGYGRDGRDPRYDPYYDRPSSRTDSYREDYRKPRESYRGYGYRDPYYDERYDRPRSRQDEERSSRPSSRSVREMDRPRSRTEYERDRDVYGQHRDPCRGGYPGYDGYGPQDYYYDDRARFYRYYRDSRFGHGYAEEMGQYYGQPDSRYGGYYGHLPPLPPLSQHPVEDFDRLSIASHSRGQTPALDDSDPSAQDYYGRTSRPSSRMDRDRERDPYRQGYGGYAGGYDGYVGGYYDQYQQYQYPYYNYQQYGQQEQGGYPKGRMTPPKYLLPHVRVCFGPTGQLVTVLPTRPAEGQPATVEIHDLQVMLQEDPEVEKLKAFPGPLIRNETHKNDVLLYCQAKAKECADNVAMLDRESAELIWRLLELLLKQNGTIIGTDIADLLLAGHEPTTHDYAVSGLRVAQSQSHNSTPDREEDSRGSSPAMRVATDRTVITVAQQLEESTDRFRNLLLYGRKKEALDWAMKRNLWGHALFLASKMDNRTHASVMTRFANTSMRMNDPLQTLYQLMSGRQPAAVTNVVDERWGDWRPHLAMILANHSSRPDLDKKSIIALGDTLATKHCLHASHFCYLMAQVDFGSFSKKNSKIVLIGSSHSLPLDEFASNGAIQCTEVYEYAQSLGNNRFCLSQYQVYKFLYACRLAEYGLVQEAFHYFEVISMQVLLNPGRYHPAFISILYSLSSKLKHGDPQKLHAGHDSADPAWLTQLCTVCQGYEEGSIQFKSGSATPMTGYGGMTPSSESGELASYGMDTSSLGGGGGLYPQESGSYTSTSYNYQQTVQTQYTGVAGQGEASVQQPLSGTDQYSQQAPADQYSWQQQQQQAYQQQQEQQTLHQQQQHQQQHYDPSQYQQQQWPGYDYSQGYGGEQQQQQQVPAQQTAAGYSESGTDQSVQQHQQHQQQVPAHNNSGGYNPEQRSSLTSQSSAADQTGEDEDDDDDEDVVDGPDAAGGSNFDYFGAAQQQKIVVPKSRYRTTSTSSAGSTGERRRRTMSGSSTGSVRAANKPSAPPAKPAESKNKNAQKGGGGSWLGGLFSKFGRSSNNEMKLPDDKDPAIVWDPVKKAWVNKDGDDNEGAVTAPPPTDNDLMGKIPPPSVPGSSAASSMNGPPTTNRFSRQKARGVRGQYVDVLNPGGSSSTKAVPPSLFNVLPGADNLNSSAAVSAPQLFNPSGAPGASSSQTDVPSNQSANSLAPPSHDLSRSSSLSSLSREIQQLTMKAQEFGDGGSSKSANPTDSQQAPNMPMMFNPANLSQPSAPAASSAGSGMKYGHPRVYPK